MSMVGMSSMSIANAAVLRAYTYYMLHVYLYDTQIAILNTATSKSISQ